MPKYKYLDIRVKPFNLGQQVACIDVTALTKREIKTEWDRIETHYPPTTHQGCLIETSQQRRCFTGALIAAVPATGHPEHVEGRYRYNHRREKAQAISFYGCYPPPSTPDTAGTPLIPNS